MCLVLHQPLVQPVSGVFRLFIGEEVGAIWGEERDLETLCLYGTRKELRSGLFALIA